jgi:integrase
LLIESLPLAYRQERIVLPDSDQEGGATESQEALGFANRTPDVADFDEYERFVDAAQSTDPNPDLIVLLGCDAGLRCREMMALEWREVDLGKRQICVQRSEWKGHVTVPKGGRLRYVPMTVRLATALREHRHLRAARVLCRCGSPRRRERPIQAPRAPRSPPFFHPGQRKTSAHRR